MREIVLFTGQWADMPLAELVVKARSWGYDGLELACSGDHFNVRRATHERSYARAQRRLLDDHGLSCRALGAHLVGQAVCDAIIDHRHRAIVPPHVWGDGEAEGVRRRAAAEMADTARAAAEFGAELVVGFTGSAIWHALAGFPPVPEADIDAGYEDFATRWGPVLDVFQSEGVRFALEIHPGEIAYDLWTARRAIQELGHPAFAFNFDPSHLHWQQVNPTALLRDLGPLIVSVHCKDAALRLDGRNGVLASHLPFGDPHRGWDFRSVGRGQIDWEEIIRALHDIGYNGPLTVEWEDAGIEREWAASDALAFVRSLIRDTSRRRFDAAFTTAPG